MAWQCPDIFTSEIWWKSYLLAFNRLLHHKVGRVLLWQNSLEFLNGTWRVSHNCRLLVTITWVFLAQVHTSLLCYWQWFYTNDCTLRSHEFVGFIIISNLLIVRCLEQKETFEAWIKGYKKRKYLYDNQYLILTTKVNLKRFWLPDITESTSGLMNKDLMPQSIWCL